MSNTSNTMAAPVALITGSGQRIGATIVRMLHEKGYNTIIHYRQSASHAKKLASELNETRENSAASVQADLNDHQEILNLAETAVGLWGRIDALINSASSFYPTPIGGVTGLQWDELINSNMKAPFFLSQALAPALARQKGSIINIADIYAEKPLAQHTIYCMAKAGNAMLTKSLAVELAPAIRVNGIAPGAILWPEQGGATEEQAQKKLLEKIPLQRTGLPEDIAKTVVFLLLNSPYITGQIISVDGGRSIHI